MKDKQRETITKYEALERLLLAHETYYDVVRHYEYDGCMFEGYAELHSSMSQYVFTKNAKIWEANSHEYIFFSALPQLNACILDEFLEFMKISALGKVTLEKNHMNTFITLVIVADEVELGLERTIRKIKFHKSYLFGFRGWVDLRVCAIDLSKNSIHANAYGRELIPTLKAVIDE